VAEDATIIPAALININFLFITHLPFKKTTQKENNEIYFTHKEMYQFCVTGILFVNKKYPFFIFLIKNLPINS